MEGGVICTAEKRLEERTKRKLEAIKEDFALKLDALDTGKETRAQTERELESALQVTNRLYETQKRQFALLRSEDNRKGEEPEGKLTIRTQRSSMDASEIPATRPLAYLEQLEKDVKASIRGHCYRLESLQQAARVKEVLMYLNLRSRGCPRPHALSFTSKLRCRIDSSQKFDGPAAMRTIKRVNNLKEGVSLNGWQVHSPKYSLPPEYQQLDLKEDEIDYDAISTCYARFEQKYNIVKGQIQEKDVIIEPRPPSSFTTLHRRFASQPVLKIVSFREQEASEKKVEKALEMTPSPALTLSPPVASLLETAATTPPQLTPPITFPRLKSKPKVVQRRSKHNIPHLPIDKIDSICVEKGSRLLVRSLPPTTHSRTSSVAAYTARLPFSSRKNSECDTKSGKK